jgi:TatD DNase family protein
MILADHHCHILKRYFESPISYLEKLKTDSDLKYIWSMGLDLESDLECLEYKKEFKDEFLKIGFGLHPSDIITKAKESGEAAVLEEFEEVKNLILENQDIIEFIGEIGIDFSYPNSRDYANLQTHVFKELLNLAKEIDKPVSIHCREAWDEVMNIIEEVEFNNEKFQGFLHSFTGDFEQGMFFIEAGFKLGLNGIITYKKSEDLRNTISELKDFYSDKKFDEIFGLETDAPYLTPEPNRADSNKPENIMVIAEFLRNV